MLEVILEEQVCKWVRLQGGVALKVKIESQRGFPDRLILLPDGIILFVELKKPDGGKTSPQQSQCLELLRSLNQHAFVCHSLSFLQNYIKGIRGMTKERYELLMKDNNAGPTLEESKEGWHFCSEWDGLLVGPGMRELEFCQCGILMAPCDPGPEGTG